MRVLEAGVGSGALSMALLRAGAEVIGYEVRPDFAAGARANVAAWAGTDASYRVEERDVYEGIDERDLDRVVLDLPEPWRALGPRRQGAAARGDRAVLPAVDHAGGDAARPHGDDSDFGMAETSEVLRRTWHVEERSVRPDHRMVAHTGFLTTARLLVPTSARPARRPGHTDDRTPGPVQGSEVVSPAR